MRISIFNSRNYSRKYRNYVEDAKLTTVLGIFIYILYIEIKLVHLFTIFKLLLEKLIFKILIFLSFKSATIDHEVRLQCWNSFCYYWRRLHFRNASIVQRQQFLSGKEEKSVFFNARTGFFIGMLCNFGSKSCFG